jgi:large subunit ribosomal protein L23
MKSPYDIIKKPVLTEKTYDQFPGRTYTFEVDKTANKIEIKKAVEEVFGVQVESVHTINSDGKMRRQGSSQAAPVQQKGLCEAEEGFQGY